MSWILWALLAGCEDKDPEMEGTDTDADTGAEAEACGDGADNDGDGLIDCEDGDCAAACAEDCRDEADNDEDGLADCRDDECLGDAACPLAYRVRLEDGIVEIEWEIADQGYDTASLRLLARDVSGTLQTLSASGAALGSCGWRFEGASFEGGDFGSVSTFGFGLSLQAREGFSVDPGCAYADSGFLRPHAGSVALNASVAWNDRYWLPADIDVYLSESASYRESFPWYFGALIAEQRDTHLDTRFGTMEYQLSPASFTFQ